MRNIGVGERLVNDVIVVGNSVGENGEGLVIQW